MINLNFKWLLFMKLINILISVWHIYDFKCTFDGKYTLGAYWIQVANHYARASQRVAREPSATDTRRYIFVSRQNIQIFMVRCVSVENRKNSDIRSMVAICTVLCLDIVFVVQWALIPHLQLSWSSKAPHRTAAYLFGQFSAWYK